MILAVLAGSWGCVRGAPAIESQPWRQAVTKAITEARAVDPERAAQLEELARIAESAEAAARADGGSLARRDRAVAAWSAALRQAGDDLTEIRLMRAEELDRIASLLEAAHLEVERAGPRAMAAGSRREDARAAAHARVRLEAGRRLLAAGDRTGAATALEDAIALADIAQDSWRRQQDRIADPALRLLWARDVRETVSASRRQGTTAVVVDKAARSLVVYRAGKPVARFPAEFGTAGLAPKRHAGDCATPEGRYRVAQVKTGGATRFYKALLLDYPNAEDRRRFAAARAAGEISPRVGIGSLIEIHGHGGEGRDWTEGCVALTDEHMDRLLELVGRGAAVTIVGAAE